MRAVRGGEWRKSSDGRVVVLVGSAGRCRGSQGAKGLRCYDAPHRVKGTKDRHDRQSATLA